MAAGSLGSQLPSYMKLAKGLDTSWHEDALCRRSPLGHEAWLTAQSDIRRGSKSEATLLERRSRAKMMCQICPVQWDCARYAVRGMMQAGTWAMRITFLRDLQKDQPAALALLDAAEAGGVSVQVAVDAHRAGVDMALLPA